VNSSAIASQACDVLLRDRLKRLTPGKNSQCSFCRQLANLVWTEPGSRLSIATGDARRYALTGMWKWPIGQELRTSNDAITRRWNCVVQWVGKLASGFNVSGQADEMAGLGVWGSATRLLFSLRA